jgi:type VI secretion system secreted protein VgrG
MNYTQENRILAIETPLGKDVFLLTGFSGTESMSWPFSFKLDLVSQKRDIQFKEIVGKKVTVSVVLADGGTRYFHGIISRFSLLRGGGETGSDPRFSHCSAMMVPWLWLLSRTANSRIFQNLSVPDIVEKIFTERQLTDYKLLLDATYEKRDYCVQYRETDFNFISRLLEEEGIFYFFEHEKGKHTLVLADANPRFKECPYQKSARYQMSTGGFLEEDTISDLEVVQEIKAGKYTLNDYNFETPSTNLKVEVPSKYEVGPGDREIYDYPGIYTNRSQGDRVTNIRMQEQEAEITTLTGSSSCRGFGTGYRFMLTDYFRPDLNDKQYILMTLTHDASQAFSTRGKEEPFAYANSFTCIPCDVTYRPPRHTPKPVVEGTQTAIVVGPGGEEIYTDQHGRVKVQFHWDRQGKNDENSSCWIRVSQVWAGAGWGGMQIPRIGQEVIIDFLEGDPDRPIIIGRVYHGTNQPPYPLPGEKTKSTIMSNSSLGGGGFNEFRFEDRKGMEEIFLHGQKDWTIAILNDKNQTVGNNETLAVGTNRTKTIGVNQTESVGANLNETVGSNKTETITIAKALTIGAGYQVTVGAAMNETVGAAKTEEIGGAKIVAVGAYSSEDVGGNSSENVGGNKSVDAGKDVRVDSGKKMNLTSGDDFGIDGKKKGVIEIADQLTIKVGSASITLKKNGDITISGKTINVKGSGNIVMKGQKILEN